MTLIVVRSRGNVASLDLDRRDAGVVKLNAEEGEVPIARRGRNGTAEEQPAVSIEVLDDRARLAGAETRARRAVWLINICEHRAETSDRCPDSTIGTRYGEGREGDVAPHRCEQTRGAERLEYLAVGWITKQHGQSALGSARRRSLGKPHSGCFELAASSIPEHEERIYRSCRVQNVGVATVPVDLAPTLLERARIIEVVGSQRSAIRIHCALD